MKKALTYFTLFEWALVLGSYAVILFFFFFFHNTNYLELTGCLIGIFSVMLVSKGSPIGQITTIIFSVFYGIVSYSFRYYGEMMTYLCMSTPIAIFALISWLRHPFEKQKNEVEVNNLSIKEYGFMCLLGLVVSVGFYFLLGALKTNNLLISTVSVFTSFIAAYMTLRRSRFYAVGYLLNDVVLIVLWSLASREDSTYLSMVITSIAFLFNDSYGFYHWTMMSKKQKSLLEEKKEENPALTNTPNKPSLN